jgi:uncharacterized protein involved in exopolysaccharide biosynthesis
MSSVQERNSNPEEAPPAPPRFRFPLPIDPIRLFAGVLTRWPWIVIGMLLFGTLGGITGKVLTRQKFSLSVSLMKRRVPQTVQTSEVGQAFRPADLNDATLLATLLSSEPRDFAFKRADNGINPDLASTFVEASQLENTDIFFITYHSPVSAEDAVRVSGILTEEIIEYTQRLQQSEARSVLSILTNVVTGLERRIDETNREMLEFAKYENYLGGEAQVAAELGKLTQVELGLEDARASEKSLAALLKELENKIRSHSPLNLRLRAAREELADLRSTYTDDNPLVQTKLEAISYLEKQLVELDADKETSLEVFTGTPLGNQIYLDIMDARKRRSEATNRIVALEKQQAAATSRLAEFPAIISKYDALRAKRESYISELSLMSKRLKEAEIFATGSPGYWQIFQPPDSRKVIPSSLMKKPVMLGVAGALVGAGLAVMITLLRTQRTTRRSVLECCATTRAPLAALLPVHQGEPSGFSNLWISILAPTFSEYGRSILLWTAGLEPADERAFWEELAGAAGVDIQLPLHILDLTPDSLWESVPLPSNLAWFAEERDSMACTILRASELPQMNQRESFSSIRRWYAIVLGDSASLEAYSASRHLTQVYLEPCSGTIVLSEPAHGHFRVFADRVSIFLARHFS